MCAGRLNFYSLVSTLDADKEARDRNIYHRFWVEKEASMFILHLFKKIS